MNEWVSAGITVVAGIAVGFVRGAPRPAALARSDRVVVRDVTPALAGLALSAGVVGGLLVALGFVAPDELEELGSDAIAFLPKAIAALIIVIGANVASTFAAAAVAKALAGTGAAARFAPMITKFAILSAERSSPQARPTSTRLSSTSQWRRCCSARGNVDACSSDSEGARSPRRSRPVVRGARR